QLSAPQLARVAKGALPRRLGKGAILFQRGDPSAGFFIVVFGQIKLAFSSAEGDEKVVEVIGPRQSFGEAVMFVERPYPVFAEALSDSLLLHLPRNAVFDLLEADNSFARRMLAGLSMRLHSLIADVESYSLRSSTQRVIGYLLQQCPTAGAAAEVSLPAAKQVIASRLNVTPETLSRIFHELSAAELIQVHGRKIAIPDLARLRQFDL
ncbi:MAG TPA: Crp/Fnr family transcriptional regulator, partial [Rhodocyclaceae bacterium]|nr:Crp/Fnr family transcriptional regulator [Rhodocyclaceae bacterium]